MIDSSNPVTYIFEGCEPDPEKWPDDARLFLSDRGIEPSAARAQGWLFADKRLIRKKLCINEGEAAPSRGILIPILTLDGGDSERWLLKVLDKRWRAKHLHPKGADTQRMMFLKGDRDARPTTVYLCESLPKALALQPYLRKGEIAIAGNGVWGAIKHGELIDDYGRTGWRGKVRYVILFDSDWEQPDKHEVRRAIVRTADALRAAGENVGITLLPTLRGHKKTGIDDFLVHPDGGAERFRTLEVRDPAEDRFVDWRVHPAVAALNRRHAIVTIGASTRVMRIDTLPGGEIEPIFQKRDDFELQYLNDRHVVGKRENGTPVVKTAAQIWLESADRVQYERVTLDPPSLPGPNQGFYNLWRGFRYAGADEQAAATSWDLFRDFILEVICCGNREHSGWVQAWMARCIQRPFEPAGVALVLQGDQGIGKGFFAKTFGALYGTAHYRRIEKQVHSVGRFNALMRDALLVFCDEAFFAGDPTIRGPLKAMITEESITIEHKNVDAFSFPNMRAYILASNEPMVVPAELDARRWAVFHVSSEHANDRRYFGAIAKQMESGGYAAMLRDLLAVKIDGRADPYRAPTTEALIEQKRLSLKPAEQFWFECAKRAEYPARLSASGLGATVEFARWPEAKSVLVLRRVAAAALLERLQEYRAHTGELRVHETMLGITVNRLFPDSPPAPRVSTPSGRDRAWVLPGLRAARAAIDRAFRGRIDWDS